MLLLKKISILSYKYEELVILTKSHNYWVKIVDKKIIFLASIRLSMSVHSQNGRFASIQLELTAFVQRINLGCTLGAGRIHNTYT